MATPKPPQLKFQFGDLTRIADKVAYVPGGAGGLGEAIAWGLAAAGARVVVGDMRCRKGRAAWSLRSATRGTKPRGSPSTRARWPTSVGRSTRSAITSGGATSWSTASGSTASKRSSRSPKRPTIR